MRLLLPFLFGALATLMGEVGLALSLVETVESEVAEVGRFQLAFNAIGRAIDDFLAGVSVTLPG